MNLNKEIVLVLNAIWQPIGYTSIKKAITSMCSTTDGENMAVQALDLEYDLKDGTIDFASPIKMIPVGINEWISLPVRDFDIPIHTSKSVVRAPIVIIAKNFSKMVMKQLHPTKKNLYHMYGGKCIWTGEKMSFNEATLEHMTPKSHGGGESWKNLALAKKSVNNERGNVPVSEWKYKAQYKLVEPKLRPIAAEIKEAIRPEWKYFLLV